MVCAAASDKLSFNNHGILFRNRRRDGACITLHTADLPCLIGKTVGQAYFYSSIECFRRINLFPATKMCSTKVIFIREKTWHSFCVTI